MAIKKIYTSGEQQLEIFWSEKGIHLEITAPDLDARYIEFTIEPNDIDSVIEDLQLYEEAVNESINKKGGE